MLSSPYVRRMLLMVGVYGLFCIAALTLIALSVPGSENTESGVAILRSRLLLGQIMLLIVGLILLAQLTGGWIKPIESLTDATRSLSDGTYIELGTIEQNDELARLTREFNDMIQKVELRHTALQLSHERAVRDNEQLATVLEAMVEGVIAVDHEERILLANSAAVRLLNLKSMDLAGRRVWEAVRLTQIHNLIQSTLAGEIQHRLEIPVPWTYSTVEAVASRLPGEPCPGAVLVLHDVTELRRLEHLRRDFVSNVSHELKTPLAAISAYAETLLNGALEDREVSHTFVTRISEQSERLNALILELLDLARMESGEHAFHVDTINVNEILQASVDAHQTIAQAKQIQLTAAFSDLELAGRADPEGLRTIIDNLIGNAINYTRPGGWVTVRSHRDHDSVIFEVEDSGVGIPKEFQTRIFERFFRVDKARSRELGGTGLGLSIVKHLCQLFGGHIKVKSQLGQGSVFTVSLNSAA